jgi:fatty-acid desaturase
MRKNVWRINGTEANAVEGEVIWAPAKSLWNTIMLFGAIALAPIYFSWSALVFFLSFTYISMLLGHSLGMHRRLIHRSFECSKPLEYFLVWLGALVGMAGPFGILKIHDLRDWAQREEKCHDFFAHRRGLLMDAFWQLHCTFKFSSPPVFRIEDEFANDRFYIFLEKTWQLQQVLFSVILFVVGGMPWLVWGVFVRVAISVASHWVVTYYAHNPGLGNWRVFCASVQASNLSHIAFLTHGECWHNNHHAFPESARMGLDNGQLDVGWIVLKWLEQRGWVWNLGLPRAASMRDDLNFEVNFLLKNRSS